MTKLSVKIIEHMQNQWVVDGSATPVKVYALQGYHRVIYHEPGFKTAPLFIGNFKGFIHPKTTSHWMINSHWAIDAPNRLAW